MKSMDTFVVLMNTGQGIFNILRCLAIAFLRIGCLMLGIMAQGAPVEAGVERVNPDPALFTVWRPQTGYFYSRNLAGATTAEQWGAPTDIPVMGDFDGDGKQDIAVWRPSTGYWYIIQSSNGQVVTHQWGASTDIPVVGDFDGDGKADIAVWRPSTGYWYIIQSSNGQVVTHQWGAPTDMPVMGDFDGDGKTDIAAWRPSNGYWYITQSSNGAIVSKQWGVPTDVPVAGDFDGDGKTDIAVWRPSNGYWYIIQSSNNEVVAKQWGQAGDIPVPKDYDGDGKTDLAVWRPSTGYWYVIPSDNGAAIATQWGASTDLPANGSVEPEELTASGGGSSAVSSIALTPASAIVTIGQTQQFVATATYSDNSTKDVTSTATWSSSAAEVATISNGGLVTGIDSGMTDIAAAVGGVTGTTSLTVNMPIPVSWTPTGLDYGLKKQCIRTVSPSQPNFFVDKTDCPDGAYPTGDYWTTAVETETTSVAPCIGVVDQSYLINGTSSPVSEAWSGSSAAGYSVELKVDFSNVANPCEPNTFTWVPLMDNWVGGGPLPPPDHLVQQFTATFTRNLPAGSGATRAMAGVGVQWNIAGSNGSAVLATFEVEINFYIDQPQWGVEANLPADVISVQSHPNASPPFYYVALDGTKLFAPVAAQLASKTALTINWAAVLQHVIDEGILLPPINGWSNSSAVTSATYVATEIQDAAVGIGGPMGDLVISNYKEGSF